MKALLRTVAAMAVGVAAAAWAQDAKKQEPAQGRPGVDPKRVSLAIMKGLAYLKTAESPGNFMSKNADELILLTFVHAGVSQEDARFKALFAKMLEAPLERTYNVALQAMVLEELQRVKYQARIYQCAQFLADNQCTNGQWSYGTPTTFTEGTVVPAPLRTVPTGTAKKAVKTGVRDFGADDDPRDKPKVVTHLAVKKNRDAGSKGDNSNSQYAALGIRASHDSGIVFPQEMIELARKYWISEQQKGGDVQGKDAVATGGGAAAAPRGWGYHEEKDGPAYGSMSAGAIGAVCIYDSMLALNWKKDKPVVDGLGWLAKNFSVTDNPAHGKEFHYYYLYALERVGMLYDTPTIGTHDWYAEGANRLLEEQRADGSWGSEERLDKPEWGTCFAILFLKLATRRLNDVASEDVIHRK
jgi:hypothetical protein